MIYLSDSELLIDGKPKVISRGMINIIQEAASYKGIELKMLPLINYIYSPLEVKIKPFLKKNV
jgi:hypothetical protein